jgi:ribosomal protein S1
MARRTNQNKLRWDEVKELAKQSAVLTGTVKGFTEFGAFVELLPGVVGLLHLSQMSHSKFPGKPSEHFHIGDLIPVVILKIEDDRYRISLGHKQLLPDPYSTFFISTGIGDRISGVITRHAPFGVFVAVGEDVEGLCHKTEMSKTERENPQKEFIVGLQYDFTIIGGSADNKRISLSRIAHQETDDPNRSSSGENFSLYFDLNEYSQADIAEMISLLSDLYRSVGGDALVIERATLLDTPVPEFV